MGTVSKEILLENKIFPVIFYKRMSPTAAFVQKHIDAKELKSKKDITASEENYLRGRVK